MRVMDRCESCYQGTPDTAAPSPPRVAPTRRPRRALHIAAPSPHCHHPLPSPSPERAHRSSAASEEGDGGAKWSVEASSAGAGRCFGAMAGWWAAASAACFWPDSGGSGALTSGSAAAAPPLMRRAAQSGASGRCPGGGSADLEAWGGGFGPLVSGSGPLGSGGCGGATLGGVAGVEVLRRRRDCTRLLATPEMLQLLRDLVSTPESRPETPV
jgi:hypothetical protein